MNPEPVRLVAPIAIPPAKKRHGFDLALARFPIGLSLLSDPPALSHVLPGLLVGTVGLLAAPGGKGKTMFLLQLAAAMALGRPICGGLFEFGGKDTCRRTAPSKVVVLLAEESAAIVNHRLHTILTSMMLGGSPLLPHKEDLDLLETLQRNLVVLPCADHGRPTLFDRDGKTTWIYEQLQQLSQGANLVLLDPLRQLHNGDEIDSGYMTEVMSSLQRIVAGTSGALMVAHHTSQASSVADYGDRAQAARGSTAITDAVRFQLNLSTPTEKWLLSKGIGYADTDHLLRVDVAKANHLPPVPTQILLRGPGGVLRQAKQHELQLRIGASSRARKGAQS